MKRSQLMSTVEPLAAEYARTRDETTLERLVVASQRWVRWLAGRYVAYKVTGTALEDLVQEGMIGLVKAAHAYRPEEASFRTWSERYISGEIRHYLRDRAHTIRPGRLRANGREVGIQPLLRIGGLPETEDGEDNLAGDHEMEDRAVQHVDLEEALRKLSPSLRATIFLVDLQEMPQTEAAKRLGSCQTMISRMHIQGMARLRGLMREAAVA